MFLNYCGACKLRLGAFPFAAEISVAFGAYSTEIQLKVASNLFPGLHLRHSETAKYKARAVRKLTFAESKEKESIGRKKGRNSKKYLSSNFSNCCFISISCYVLRTRGSRTPRKERCRNNQMALKLHLKESRELTTFCHDSLENYFPC